MVDFLRQNPFVTKEEYMWKWTVPQIKLATYDYTRVQTLTDEEAEKQNATVINSAEELMNDLGVNIDISTNASIVKNK
jgi:hypothetical protein